MIASVSGKRLHCNPVIIILIIALALMLICHFQKRSELTHFTNCMGCPVSITGVGSEKPSHPSCQHPLPLNCDISRRLCQLRSKCPLVYSRQQPSRQAPLHRGRKPAPHSLLSQHRGLKPPAPPSYKQVSPPALWRQVSLSTATPPLSPPCSELVSGSFMASTGSRLDSSSASSCLPLPSLLSSRHPSCCLTVQLYPTLGDPMDCSILGFPVLHYLPEFAQTHVC